MTFPTQFSDNVASLAGASAVNTVGAVADAGEVRANSAMVVVTSAGVTAGAVQLQGSLDATNWFPLGAAVTTNAASTVFPVFVASSPTRYVRAKVTTAITGGTVNAQVAMAI
jgi:hypothetical protein